MAQIFQNRIEEDNQLFIVVDRLVLVAEFRIVRLVILDNRLNLADGLAPMNLIVAAGIDDPMFHGALLLDENRDFNHNENKMRMDFSKKKFAKELDTFLRQTNQQTGKSNWNTLQDDWNKNNVRVRTSKTKYQPDYTHIERYRK